MSCSLLSLRITEIISPSPEFINAARALVEQNPILPSKPFSCAAHQITVADSFKPDLIDNL
jgi:hypothetical protein